jgi:peptidylprolyl isomerase
MKSIQWYCAGTVRGRGLIGGLVLRAGVLLTALAASSTAQQPARPPLTDPDIDAIARLVMLEDRRELDEAAVARSLRSVHPEVRRRAALAVGRIADVRGRALLVAARMDSDTAVAATVVFSTGQLADTASIEWLATILSAPNAPPTVAREAAGALGKIRTPEAHAALARFLIAAPAAPRMSPVVGEALLSIGRFTTRGDLAPVLRWTTSPDTAIRWRAAWALMRPRDPAAVTHLLRLSDDPSPEVRFWAVRGLVAALADSAGIDRQRTSARLRAATSDADRRVRTEALRALGTYDDDASFAIILGALDSPDSWISVSAAEAMGRFQSRAAVVVPRLIAASQASRPRALRITALQPLATLAPDAARALAGELALDSNATARQAATQALRRLDAQAAARADSATVTGAARGNPTTPRAPAPPQAQPQVQAARGSRTADTSLTIAHYRRIVERWVVPDYNGAAKRRAVWETPRGAIELELYPGDAPLAVDYFMRLVESGEIVGTEFGRVVPNFVAQQRTIANAVTLRDEVNRHGLTRANLSWASAGLDTGRPGYTLGSTPQPHNEGGFTALGRVVRGMDVVDRLELGDPVSGARIIR